MGVKDNLIRDLRKMFVGWGFTPLDAHGFLSGLITGWLSNLALINSFVVSSGLCTELYC